MKKLILIGIASLFIGCATVDSSHTQIEHWHISQDHDLKDLGVNSLRVLNERDTSKVWIADKNNLLKAVSIFVQNGDDIGIQYQKQNPKHLEYIKIRDSGNIDKPFIKIYKNEQGQWVFSEFEKESDRQPSRFEIIDLK